MELAVELWDRADLLVSSQLVYPRPRGALAAASGYACALELAGDDILFATWDNGLNAAARAMARASPTTPPELGAPRITSANAVANKVARKSCRAAQAA